MSGAPELVAGAPPQAGLGALRAELDAERVSVRRMRGERDGLQVALDAARFQCAELRRRAEAAAPTGAAVLGAGKLRVSARKRRPAAGRRGAPGEHQKVMYFVGGAD